MRAELSKILQSLEQDVITDKEARILLFNLLGDGFSLPEVEIKRYCDMIENQEGKLISKSKMGWYKLGIETGLRAFPVLFKDYISFLKKNKYG